MSAEPPKSAYELIAGLLALVTLTVFGHPLAAMARSKDGDSGAMLSAMPGMGVALVTCIWLMISYIGGTVWPVLGAVTLGVSALFAWRIWQGRKRAGSKSVWPVVLISLIALIWRIFQVRGLAFPAWVDPVHHALIVRKMLEVGHVPADLAPYLPGPFFYHFAFHALAASVARVSGLGIPQAILVMGQVLQALVVLSVYRLGWTVWRNPLWAGVAALLVTFVSQTPAHYTAWGKYPLLTAMVLLPLAMSLTLEVLRDGVRVGRVVALSFVVAGAITAHYFSALTLALFVAVVLAKALIKGRSENGVRALIALIAGCGLGALFVAPWMAWVWANAGRFVAVQAGDALLTPDRAYYPGYLDYLWALTGPTRNRLLLALAVPGLALALRRSSLQPVGIWFLLLLLLGSPWGWRLQPFSPDRVLIMLWLPAVLLATEALATLMGGLNTGGRFGKAQNVRQFDKLPYVLGALVAVVLAWCAWGAVETKDLVRDVDILADAADARALSWVEDNVPADACFFIGVAPWPPYGYRGTDGGWWLLPVTGRQTLLPPALYGLGDSREVERLNSLAERAACIRGCGPAFWDLVADADITHVYLNAARSTLQPRGFDGCPAVEAIYTEGDVHIYRLLWPPAD